MVSHLSDVNVEWLLKEDAVLFVLLENACLMLQKILDMAIYFYHRYSRIVHKIHLADPFVLKLLLEFLINQRKY
jgi:hypothetical protein